jgi:hypothetical protein
MNNTINFCDILDEKFISQDLLNTIKSINFNYDYVSKEKHNEIVVEIENKINSGTLSKSGDINKWEKGWSENLTDLKKTGNIDSLIPKYYHPNSIYRLDGKFIIPNDSNFEINILFILLRWISTKYLLKCDNIFEFGCGSAYNLTILSKLLPNKTLYGLDWSQASIDIIEYIKNKYNYKIESAKFNMFTPDFDLNILENSGILTIGTLEQMHTNFKPFVDFLLIKKPKIICQLETVFEFYDENDTLDSLAIKFHKQRNYLIGYYSYLKQLESENKIKIIKSTRMSYGNLFHNGWSILIWEIL